MNCSREKMSFEAVRAVRSLSGMMGCAKCVYIYIYVIDLRESTNGDTRKVIKYVGQKLVFVHRDEAKHDQQWASLPVQPLPLIIPPQENCRRSSPHSKHAQRSARLVFLGGCAAGVGEMSCCRWFSALLIRH